MRWSVERYFAAIFSDPEQRTHRAEFAASAAELGKIKVQSVLHPNHTIHTQKIMTLLYIDKPYSVRSLYVEAKHKTYVLNHKLRILHPRLKTLYTKLLILVSAASIEI